tara:strand:+ start:1560 stop:2471 length:912 start_codon:yes stop_codon:yes gene_type:complete
MNQFPILRNLDLEGRVDHFKWLYEEHSSFVSQEDREYFWGKGLSNSGLSKFSKSADHYFWDDFVKTQALVVGSATHCYILEPDKFDSRFVIAPKIDKRTKAGKEEWAEFEKTLVRKDGRDIEAITEEEFGMIVNMKKAVQNHGLARSLLSEGISEETIVWNDEKTGCLMKGKLDWRRPEEKIIIDLKTTRDASREGVLKSAFNYRYHVQQSVYIDGVQTITGENDYRFMFIFVEKYPPYGVSVIELDDVAYDLGHKQYITDIEKVTLWLEIARNRLQEGMTDVFSGYSEDVILLETPHWMIKH